LGVKTKRYLISSARLDASILRFANANTLAVKFKILVNASQELLAQHHNTDKCDDVALTKFDTIFNEIMDN
jgi:hypothetical protein